MSLPTVAGSEPIVAWRFFKFYRPHYLGDLGGAVINEPRQRGDAFCPVNEEHIAPDETCSCGFYAFKTKELRDTSGYQVRTDVVGAQVYLWGKVIECSEGYKAQFIYPKELEIYNDKMEAIKEWLGYKYGVPCSRVESPSYSFKGETGTVTPKKQTLSLEFYINAALHDEVPADLRRHALMTAVQRLKGKMDRIQDRIDTCYAIIGNKRSELHSCKIQMDLLLAAKEELKK